MTPACIITADNPIGDPTFRAQLSRIILGEGTNEQLTPAHVPEP